ncbi:vWA domain-containing protein [Bauldia sp.]|uniref:vWA domain-containing protein n=1 Tax=Bauldia sp. TaxID=2575872 RepID=UPI003BAC7C62
MQRTPTFRPISLLIATAISSAAVLSLSVPVANARVIDGIPDPVTCARLGFGHERADRGAPRGRAPGKVLRNAAPIDALNPAPTPQAPAIAMESAADFAVPPVDTERYPDATPNPIKQAANEPVSTFSIDVDTASYANVRRFLNDGHLPPRDAVRVEELINYFDYGYDGSSDPDIPFSVHASVVPSPWAEGREIIHIGLQGYDIEASKRPPLNLVFLMDVSGSMDDPAKLPLVQKALNLLVDELRPEDQVSIAVYAGAAGAVLAPTQGDQKLKIRCAIDAMRAGGSTGGGEGLALAYGMAEQGFDGEAVNRVILMTDGDFNVGVADPERLEDFVAEKRDTGVYLSVYGVGRGNYNDVMMQTLSQSGNGTAAYIDTLQEARKLFRDDFSGSLFPIADDVKIQVEFNPARVAEYRLIGYETRALDRADFNNDQVDAGETGAGASVTALYEITPVGGPAAIDRLRYRTAPIEQGDGGELAFLRIRFKQPGGHTSELIEQPIGDIDRPETLDETPESSRWALAVAAYGQKLRGDPWINRDFDWEAVIALANGAKGEDPFGIRAEFVQLARAAETARSVNE